MSSSSAEYTDWLKWYPPRPTTAVTDQIKDSQNDLEEYVFRFLNTSADPAYWPDVTSFGGSPIYMGDLVELEWPREPLEKYQHRAVHCLPCTGNITYPNKFNWTSCMRESNDAKATLFNETFLIQGAPNNRKVRRTVKQLPRIPNDSNTELTAICALGIPGTNPYEISRHFPFNNAPRVEITGKGPHKLNRTYWSGGFLVTDLAKELIPSDRDLQTEILNTPSSSRALYKHEIDMIIAGCVFGFLIFPCIYLCCRRSRKMERKAAARASADQERAAAVAADARTRAEELELNELPKYEALEGPPAYTANEDNAGDRLSSQNGTNQLREGGDIADAAPVNLETRDNSESRRP